MKKLKFETVYLETWDDAPFSELKNREYVLDTLKMEKDDDPVAYFAFKTLIEDYEDVKDGKKEGILDQFELMRCVELGITYGDKDMVYDQEEKEYDQARVSYLRTLFDLASKDGLPPRMPLTNIFNPRNKFAKKIKGDYAKDYKMVLKMCE